MSEQETIADIIAEMKRRKEMLEDAAFNAPLCYSTETVQAQHEILDEFIERFEAAYKRERGDCAKLREALVALMIDFDSNYADDDDIASWCDVNIEVVHKARAALAAPPRNCDVGTAREQLVQYTKFCYAHRSHEKGCGGCPLNGEPCCELAWAQMPYEEGGGK